VPRPAAVGGVPDGILGLPSATRFAHFLVAGADNGVWLDFAETTGAITPQHYAFLVGEEDFDAAFGRIRSQDLPYWADPGQSQPGVINHRDGGRGLYFEDPNGHLLEIITRPTAAAANAPACLVQPSQAEPPPTASRPTCSCGRSRHNVAWINMRATHAILPWKS
jgi:catechol 2,3-dioxygenase-like lactoylglutathione lyase family enzyme